VDDGGVSLEVGGLVRGFWQYLLARLRVRAELERERERNRIYADHRDRLPDNCELLDSEGCQGRVLWIRKGAQAADGADGRFPVPFVLAAEVVQSAEIEASRRQANGDGR
jgi:hypothetical protein